MQLMTQEVKDVKQELSLDCLSNDKIELLKETIFKGATDNELKLFLHTCQGAGLDPFLKQIYAVKRWNKDLKKETMTTQVSIDGLRLIADRTGKYAPGKECDFVEDKNGKLVSATAYVQKRTQDGTWHTCSTTVRFNEYCATDANGRAVALWATKPYTMLAKVAEAHTLRKCFPAETVGLYTKEELDASAIDVTPDVIPLRSKQLESAESRRAEIEKSLKAKESPFITASQVGLIRTLLRNNFEDEAVVIKTKNISKLEELKKEDYAGVLKSCQKRYDTLTQETRKQIDSAKPAKEPAVEQERQEVAAIDTGEVDAGF